MSEQIRAGNHRWLKSFNPDLQSVLCDLEPDVSIAPSRSGALTLSIAGQQIHSSYDPVREAEQFAIKSLDNVPAQNGVILFGLGLGYIAEAIRKKHPGKLAVVEADPTVFSAAVGSRDLSTLGDVKLVVGGSAVEVVGMLESFVSTTGGWDKVTLVAHPASVKRFPDYYREIEALLQARSKVDVGRLGILVATPMYGGSLPIAHYCADAFRRLGHRVDVLDNSIYDPARQQIDAISRDRRHRGTLGEILTTLMAESITAKALDRAVDLVWLVAQSPMTPRVADELKKHGIPTAFWFVEEWQLLTYWKEWATRFDYFFTVQRSGFHAELARMGVKHHAWLPLAADPDLHRPLSLTPAERAEFGSDVSHVGAGYRNRRHVFSSLAGFDFKLWGSDWENPGLLGKSLQRNGTRISTEESVKIFNATTVNVNLHSSQFHDGVNPEGDYLNPRTFEIASTGGFQLVDARKDLPGHFEAGEEIALFHDARELPLLISHYLNRPDERKHIAEKGRERVLKDHTYDLRMQQALEFIYSREARKASLRHPNHIENLRKMASDDPELTELLSRFEAEGVLTLDDVIEKIRQNSGELNDAELIFLLMHEFRRWAGEKDLV
jgi:spore maturation protein CgeB